MAVSGFAREIVSLQFLAGVFLLDISCVELRAISYRFYMQVGDSEILYSIAQYPVNFCLCIDTGHRQSNYW